MIFLPFSKSTASGFSIINKPGFVSKRSVTNSSRFSGGVAMTMIAPGGDGKASRLSTTISGFTFGYRSMTTRRFFSSGSTSPWISNPPTDRAAAK